MGGCSTIRDDLLNECHDFHQPTSRTGWAFFTSDHPIQIIILDMTQCKLRLLVRCRWGEKIKLVPKVLIYSLIDSYSFGRLFPKKLIQKLFWFSWNGSSTAS